MNETATALRRRERDLWGDLVGQLFDLAVLLMLGFGMFRAARNGDWAWVTVDAACFLAMTIEHAANKVARAIEETQP